MDLSQIPLFAMLRGRLGYLSERQQLIAQNVANSDTPGYLAKDLRPFSFQAQVQTAMTRPEGLAQATTQAGHMALPLPAATRAGKSGAKQVTVRDSETTLNGNAVVLEEQMMKMSEARMDYDAAIGFYQKSLSLIRMAARAPGR